MVEAVVGVADGTLRFRPQAEEGILYATKIDKAEARIDWTRPAKAVHDAIRGLSPFPGAWFEADLGKGPERIKVLRSRLEDGSGRPGTTLDAALSVGCGDGAVRLVEIQPAGRTRMSADDYLLGTRIAAGTRL